MSGLLGAGYESSGDEAPSMSKPAVAPATTIVAAPEVNTEVWFPELLHSLSPMRYMMSSLLRL